MNEFNYYSPEEVKPLYGEIVPVYQEAFKEEPWNSTTKCVDLQFPTRCKDSYSSLEIGEQCGTCGLCPTRQAYEYDELASTFDNLAETRPTSWYLEKSNGRLALVMLSWKATSETIASEKYMKTPEMKDWIQNKIGEEPIGWLDEVFADRSIRDVGNLGNFVDACVGMASRLEIGRLAFRTVQPKMIRAAERFGEKSQIFQQSTEVPDWRDFVLMNIEGKQR